MTGAFRAVPRCALKPREIVAVAVLASVVAVVVFATRVAAQTEDPTEVPDSLEFKEVQSQDVRRVPIVVEEDASGFDTVGDFESDFAFEDISEDSEVKEDLGLAVHYAPYLHFNRVDAWTYGLDLGFRPHSGWWPRYDMRIAYAVGRSSWLYALSIKQPVLSERRLLLGLGYRRFTDDYDKERVGSIENFVSAFGFKYDYRDYFQQTGGSLFAQSTPLPWLFASLTYVSYDFKSITDIASGSWTIFRNSEAWRENPGVVEGRLRSVELIGELDRRDAPSTPTKGWWARVGAEWADKDLSADFTYSRYWTELRGYLSPQIDERFLKLKGRMIVGTAPVGPLPFQKQFAVGGISTLRASNYKTRRGDHAFLFNADAAFQIWGGREKAGIRTNIDLLVFADVGSAWSGERFDLNDTNLLTDVGIGAAIAQGKLQFYAAQNLQNTKFDPLFSVRLDTAY